MAAMRHGESRRRGLQRQSGAREGPNGHEWLAQKEEEGVLMLTEGVWASREAVQDADVVDRWRRWDGARGGG